MSGTVSTPAPGRLEVVRQFINTLDIEEGTDSIASAAGLRRWLREASLLSTERRVTTDDVAAARALREALRAAAAANHDGTALPDNVLACFDQAAERAEFAVRLTPDRRWRLLPQAAGAAGALGHLIAFVTEAMSDGSWQRLKVCANDKCQWAFFDASRSGTGRWCSMAICGNRAKQEAWRARHRTR
jgi:predicted RNA-binding Zn ribbon-like protein